MLRGSRLGGAAAAGVFCGVAMLVAGCGAEAPPDAPGTLEQDLAELGLIDGTPNAVGVLALLDDNDTTVAVLDVDAGLDKRAAENLILHRDGADLERGTQDDNPFDTMAEVDAVPYVGPSALAKLLSFATKEGYVPSGGDLLGVFDNVAFTVDEAEATLSLVNTADFAVLDVDAGLDKRAVDSIFAAREIVSLLELASLHYVGQSAMLKLRTFAKTYTGPTGPKKGYWEECGAHEECEENLCVGLLSSDQGWCAEAWQANTFSSSQVVAIPDGGPAASSEITVSGLASVPMDVIVTLDIDHPRPQDLHVGLHQPGGAYAVLWNNHPSPPSVVEQPLGVEFDNMVNGVWRLEVVDTATGEVGTIDGWSMWISSRWD